MSELSDTKRGENGFGSTGTDNKEVSAAAGTEAQASEQPQSVPEQAAAQDGAEVGE